MPARRWRKLLPVVLVSLLGIPTALAQRHLPPVHRGLSAQHAFHASGGYTAHWNVHRPGFGLSRCAVPSPLPATFASSYYYRHHYGRSLACYRPSYGYSYYRYSSYCYPYPASCYYPAATLCSPCYVPPACFFPILYPTGSYFFFSAPTVISPLFAQRLRGNADPVVQRDVPAVPVALGNAQQNLVGASDPAGMLDILRAHQEAELARRGDTRLTNGAALAQLLRQETPPSQTRRIPSAEWLAQGERAFQAGRYAEAAQDFQRAAERAPGNVTAWLYLGFTEIARGDRDHALAAFRTAARQVDSFDREDCKLDLLYGDNSSAKLDHLDQLAKSALAHPESPECWLLVGTFLWFDGQVARADKFLAKAQSLAAPQEELRLAQVMRR